MQKHIVSVKGFVEIPGNTSRDIPNSTTSFIEVRPPLTVGENFGAAVLGANHSGVSIKHVGDTDEATVFYAESNSVELDEFARRERIGLMAYRIYRFVNQPNQEAKLMQESPFPDPKSYQFILGANLDPSSRIVL